MLLKFVYAYVCVCVYTYIIVVSVMSGVVEYRMVICVRGGLVSGRRRRQCRQRAQGDHSDLWKIAGKSDVLR